MSDKYKISDKDNLSRTCFGRPYYLRLTVVGWVDVFTRPNHKAVIVDSSKLGSKFNCRKAGRISF